MVIKTTGAVRPNNNNNRKTKKTLFEHWLAHPDQANIKTAFQQLSWQPTNTDVEV